MFDIALYGVVCNVHMSIIVEIEAASVLPTEDQREV
jgi:hypothetical protein